MKNATYLFEKPSRYTMRNSESRWTTIAQISLFYISSTTSREIPIYSSDSNGNLGTTDHLTIKNFSFLNTVCEQRINGDTFEISDFDPQFIGLSPDILHLRDRHTTLIEVKTIGASVAGNIDRYDKLCRYLQNQSWSCDLYYLLSHGHEVLSDWRLLAEKEAKIILWEDLLRIMTETPLAKFFGGDNIGNYCAPHETLY